MSQPTVSWYSWARGAIFGFDQLPKRKPERGNLFSAQTSHRPNIVQIHRFDPTLSTTWVQLGCNLGPTCHNCGPNGAPNWTCLEQLRPELNATWGQHGGHGRPNTQSRRLKPLVFTGIVFKASMKLPDCIYVGPNLLRSCCQRARPSESAWAQLQGTWLRIGPMFDPRGRNFGPSWACLGGTLAEAGQNRPILQTQCHTLQICIFTVLFSLFVWLPWEFVMGCPLALAAVALPYSSTSKSGP